MKVYSILYSLAQLYAVLGRIIHIILILAQVLSLWTIEQSNGVVERAFEVSCSETNRWVHS